MSHDSHFIRRTPEGKRARLTEFDLNGIHTSWEKTVVTLTPRVLKLKMLGGHTAQITQAKSPTGRAVSYFCAQKRQTLPFVYVSLHKTGSFLGWSSSWKNIFSWLSI